MIDMLCSVHSTISFQGFKEDAVWMIEMADEGEEMHKISRFFLQRITTYKNSKCQIINKQNNFPFWPTAEGRPLNLIRE